MNHERVGDVVLGTTMILIGIAPLVLILTGSTQPFGTLSENLNAALLFAFQLFGLILVAAGFVTIKNGRAESNSTSLY
jgi:hypothetical protein